MESRVSFPFLVFDGASMNQSFSSTASPVSYSWTRRIAIAVCLVVGVIYSIRALTRPAQATSSSTQDEQQPIETVQLGQRVVGRNPLREQTQLASDIRPETWRAVRLEMDAHGVKYDLAFLRSVDWIEAAGAQVGGMIDLRMPEMGLSGPALVKAIDPCPPIEPDDGEGRSVVTGTMSHPAANLLDIAIEGEPEPLGVTTTHPMWSEDQLRFVVAGDLKIGERLQRADGTLTQITRITPHTGPPVMVHNLEVDGEHVYCVGGGGLLVHNDCENLIYRGGGTNPGNLTPRPDDDGMLSFRDSLSNPIDPVNGGPLGGRPVFGVGDKYISVDANRLPAGSVIRDNVPPGHVSVFGVSPEDLKDLANVGRLPK